MLSWTLTLCLMGLILIGWFWQSSLGVRERANHAAQDACERMQLQFLDGTVAFASLRLTRDETGRIALRRTYVFDYTAGNIERRQGFVVMLGRRLEHIGFENDEPTRRYSSAPPINSNSGNDSNVLNLDDWRRRRARAGQLPANPGHNHDSSSDNGW